MVTRTVSIEALIEHVSLFRSICFRGDDVLSLHKNRAHDLRARRWLDFAHEPILGDTALQTGVHVQRRVGDARDIFQLRAKPADGKVHGESEIVWPFRDEHLRHNRWCVHCSRIDRFFAVSLGQSDTKED